MTGILDELKSARIPDDTTMTKLVSNLYENCLNVIKLKNKLGVTDMIYEVPVIHMGFPLYDHEVVSLKLNNYFKKKGFKTTYYHPCKIYIKWK